MRGQGALRRKRAAAAAEYRSGYLQSKAWWARRTKWLRIERASRGQIVCPGCDVILEDDQLHLHHATYERVARQEDGTWSAAELHEDLVAMCPSCHFALHRIFDLSRALAHLGRATATARAISIIRQTTRRSDEKEAT